MLYRHKQGTFEVCPYKATYTVKRDSVVEDGTDEEGNITYKPIKIDVEETRYVHDKEWFESILNEHEDYSNLVYEDIVLTEEQQLRFEQIRSLPEWAIGVCIEYVMTGAFPEGINHPLRSIQLEKENRQLGQDLCEGEINEIIQGMQLSDLELQVLELTLGGVK